MGNDWKTYRLGELFETASGLSKSRKEFGFGSPFVSFRDVFWNTFLPDELESLANTSATEQEKCSVKKGDVFLTRTSETPNELGMSSVALKDYPQATFNGFTKRLRLKKEINVDIDPVYLGYYLRSNKFRQSIFAHSTMTTRASLNNASISILEIDLPPINEQIKIGKQLKALDDKIELNRQMNQTLEQMAQALFKSWFVDFDPVIDNALQAGNEIPEPMQKRAQQRKALGEKQKSLPQPIQQLFPAEFEFSEELDKWVPKGWKIGITKDTCEKIQNGGTPRRDTKEFWENGSIPWLTSGEVRQTIITEVDNSITELGFAKSSAKWIPRGSTVVALYGATAGQVSYLSKSLTTNQAVCGLIPKNNFQHYNYLSLSRIVKDFENLATGSAQQNISKSIVENMNMLIPPESLTKVFEQKCSAIFLKWEQNLMDNQSLTKLRDTLLPKLVSEEVKIPNEIFENH